MRFLRWRWFAAATARSPATHQMGLRMKNVFAYTEPTGVYPGYVSINEVDGKLSVTVRSPPLRAPDGYIYGTGQVAAIEIPASQESEFFRALRSRRAATCATTKRKRYEFATIGGDLDHWCKIMLWSAESFRIEASRGDITPEIFLAHAHQIEFQVEQIKKYLVEVMDDAP